MSTAHPRPRWPFVVNAAVAWFGVVATVLLSALGSYDPIPVEEGLYGGATTPLARVVESLSYFTVWSNIAVAVTVTLLALRPGRTGHPVRVLRLSSLLMITVTALVYQLVLAPLVDVTGWARLTDPVLHAVTPALTLLVWAVWGPRGQVTLRLVPWALLLPALWIAWMLVRGAVVDAYPYGFVNVVVLGYPLVARNLLLVLLLALVLAIAFWALDVALGRRRSRRGA